MYAAALLAAITGLFLASVIGHGLHRAGLRTLGRWERRLSAGAIGAFALLVVAWAWARFVEPRWIDVTWTTIDAPSLPPGYRLRIVQLSDLGVTGPSSLLEKLPQVVDGLDPDLVVFTGNALNSAEGLPAFRAALSSMHARLGVFAVRGNYDSSEWSDLDLFGGGVANELQRDAVKLDGDRVTLCGAAYGNGALNLERCLNENPGGFRIVLFNTPDWVEKVSALETRPGLYLAGHTRGGQVRIPFYGALVTGYARFGKKYEMGRYQVGDTVLYVNRGIGSEPRPFPQVRFNCRPEVAVIELVGPSR